MTGVSVYRDLTCVTLSTVVPDSGFMGKGETGSSTF